VLERKELTGESERGTLPSLPPLVFFSEENHQTNPSTGNLVRAKRKKNIHTPNLGVPFEGDTWRCEGNYRGGGTLQTVRKLITLKLILTHYNSL